MKLWEERTLKEIEAANLQETFALRNSLPEYLSQLSAALSESIDRTMVRKRFDKMESTRVGKKHGNERAKSFDYTMDQMIMEYHILRQVVCDVMEEEIPLTVAERELIVSSVEQAVNDAATEFSNTLKNLQEHLSQILAHDLRNPIAAAKISAQIILKQPDDQDSSVNKASRIIACMDRIDGMIIDLLDASRVRAGEGLPLAFKECDLDWIAREVVFEMNIAHEDRFIVLSHGKCVGNWNSDGLRRLIENLASNAVKYGAPNTTITLTLEQDDESATFSLHNVGDPIPASYQVNLFQKFKRAKSAEEKVGWGLGLTVVKGMVDAHRGSILVESELNKGTTFIVRIPKDPTKVADDLSATIGLILKELP
ncbi:MAG: HAMP domain-containing histidine kinase [Bdellovibrionales bacterium]|nr:HAMP domain-containing histidine kinase [Bdellovibrionales bacterium]